MYYQMENFPKQLWYTGGPQPYDVWDPLGLSKGASKEQLMRWREVELKHSRVCMLACAGWWANTDGHHWVGDAGARFTLSDDPLIAVTQMPMAGLWQVLFTIMAIEWMFTYVVVPDPEYPWDLLGWSELITKEGQQQASYKASQCQELNNGRAAMIGILGLIGTEIGSGGKNIGNFPGASGLNPFPGAMMAQTNLQFGNYGSDAHWPYLDPRFDPQDILAWFGGFNNFILYAKGINPFADQLV
jgi:hypothetical protein